MKALMKVRCMKESGSLAEAIRSQEREINRIKNSFPYTQLELLLNEEKLSDRISEYEHLLDELNDEYDRLLSNRALQ